ncbi:uncharacterized protein DDB_G0283697-like [Papaver somniferum]|uniref:uncharacterized protein DDB_G0283697-like n=1 Tax=Papaver somniferum TaxID=3469 RepID=UPI000E6FCB4A|nr:uncharacterized protein DDB_G0283697-like [Papaver somniferum]
MYGGGVGSKVSTVPEYILINNCVSELKTSTNKLKRSIKKARKVAASKQEDETLADYRQRRGRFQRRRLAAEEKLRPHADGVASDSDASGDEPVWVLRECKIKPHRRTREIKRLVEDDLESEHKEEEYWDMMYIDTDEIPDFVNISNSDSKEETYEDSSKDNNDDESDNSDKSDDSDESDASDD